LCIKALNAGDVLLALASAYKALADQVRALQRLLGKKTMEAEFLKEVLDHATGSKKQMLRSLSLPMPGSRDDTP